MGDAESFRLLSAFPFSFFPLFFFFSFFDMAMLAVIPSTSGVTVEDAKGTSGIGCRVEDKDETASRFFFDLFFVGPADNGAIEGGSIPLTAGDVSVVAGVLVTATDISSAIKFSLITHLFLSEEQTITV